MTRGRERRSRRRRRTSMRKRWRWRRKRALRAQIVIRTMRQRVGGGRDRVRAAGPGAKANRASSGMSWIWISDRYVTPRSAHGEQCSKSRGAARRRCTDVAFFTVDRANPQSWTVVASLVIADTVTRGPRAARTNTKSERFSEKRALTRVRVQGASTGDIAYGSWLLAYSIFAFRGIAVARK